MKRFLAITISAMLATFMVASVASAAPAKAQALKCFSGGGATCVVSNDNAATLDVPAGGYAGVYVNGKSYSNKPLASVDFSFDYWGDVSGGSPRLSIPINVASLDHYAFLDAAGCGYVTDVTPNTFHTVSTTLSTCATTFQGVTYGSWDAFAAANPTLRISNGTLAFVIADQPGHVVIYSASTK